MERLIGKVKWFNARKGFGFITRIDADQDFFVHHTGISSVHDYRVLHEGDDVSFLVGQRNDRSVAIDVQVITADDYHVLDR